MRGADRAVCAETSAVAHGCGPTGVAPRACACACHKDLLRLGVSLIHYCYSVVNKLSSSQPPWSATPLHVRLYSKVHARTTIRPALGLAVPRDAWPPDAGARDARARRTEYAAASAARESREQQRGGLKPYAQPPLHTHLDTCLRRQHEAGLAAVRSSRRRRRRGRPHD
jgi:hypothetical protein